MYKKIITFLILVLGFLTIANYSPAYAGYYDDSLVPCGPRNDDGSIGTDNMCTLCHFVLMARNIFDFFLKVSLALAVVFIIIAGVIYMVSSGNEGLITTAKNAVKYTVAGFAICLLAWVMVNSLARLLGYHGSDKWWEVTLTCEQNVGEPTSLYDAGYRDAGDSPDTPVLPPGEPVECDESSLSQEVADLCQYARSNVADTSYQQNHVFPDLDQCIDNEGCVNSGRSSGGRGTGPKVINKNLLEGLKCAIDDSGGSGKVGVSSVCGGNHSNTSKHYICQALDISRIFGTGNEAKDGLKPVFDTCFAGRGCTFREEELWKYGDPSNGYINDAHLHIQCP